jgi:hypothetical protein
VGLILVCSKKNPEDGNPVPKHGGIVIFVTNLILFTAFFFLVEVPIEKNVNKG